MNQFLKKEHQRQNKSVLYYEINHTIKRQNWLQNDAAVDLKHTDTCFKLWTLVSYSAFSENKTACSSAICFQFEGISLNPSIFSVMSTKASLSCIFSWTLRRMIVLIWNIASLCKRMNRPCGQNWQYPAKRSIAQFAFNTSSALQIEMSVRLFHVGINKLKKAFIAIIHPC